MCNTTTSRQPKRRRRRNRSSGNIVCTLLSSQIGLSLIAHGYAWTTTLMPISNSLLQLPAASRQGCKRRTILHTFPPLVMEESTEKVGKEASLESFPILRVFKRGGIHKKGTRSSSSSSSNSNSKLPPWLSRLEESENDDVVQQLQFLEYLLQQQDFSPLDIQDIVQTMEIAAGGDITKLVGMVEFCHLMLQLEEPSAINEFATKNLLLASILHYGDCVTARQTGVYNMVKKAIYNEPIVPEQDRLLPEASQVDDEIEIQTVHKNMNEASRTKTIMETEWDDDGSAATSSISTLDVPQIRTTYLVKNKNIQTTLPLGEEVMRIAKGASRIKQIEILASSVLGETRVPDKEESARLRGLLLTIMDDWRGLAIRSAAALYRLEGILRSTNSWSTGSLIKRSPQIVQTARDALRIYAPLASRLGMHRLKTLLEERAFRILYRRQYQAVSAVYRQVGETWDSREEMQYISAYLTSHITQLVGNDSMLKQNLEDFKVTSRVKEPYSMWKKLLQAKLASTAKSPTSSTSNSTASSSSLTLWSSSELSILDVMDAVALRVILKARKLTPDELESKTHEREKLLCYYVQTLIQDHWPATNESRIKDYIHTPKSNGYQSLHYTSSISCHGEDWPFEVQVRSEEMHQIAEYGVAAHFDYKLGSARALTSTRENNLPHSFDTPIISELHDDKPTTVLVNDDPSEPDGSYIDALVTAQEDLVQQKVFLFLAGSSSLSDEEGQLISLPVGARVCDALAQLEEELHRDLKHEKEGQRLQVFCNGRAAQLEDFVGNGDVLLVTL